jgi:hypothetical protein
MLLHLIEETSDLLGDRSLRWYVAELASARPAARASK